MEELSEIIAFLDEQYAFLDGTTESCPYEICLGFY